jgi:DNA repair photolyase
MEKIEGCAVIYQPGGEAYEYGALATNPYRGCGHLCLYCYVPRQLKMTRAQFDAGAEERKKYAILIVKDAAALQRLGNQEQVFLCFTTDPYHPYDSALTRHTIVALHDHGQGVCILTKGGDLSLRDLDLLLPHRDCYGFTMTSLDADFAAYWEAQAASPTERLHAAALFASAGIWVWGSLEPVIDIEHTLRVFQALIGKVQHVKIGTLNQGGKMSKAEKHRFVERILRLAEQPGAPSIYWKRNFWPYLPPGWVNPMRITQHF